MSASGEGIVVVSDVSDGHTVVALVVQLRPGETGVAWAVAALPGRHRGARVFAPIPDRYCLSIRYRSETSTILSRPVSWRPGSSLVVRLGARLDPAGRLCLGARESPGRRLRRAIVKACPALPPEACALVSSRGVPVLPPLPLIAGAQLWLDTSPPLFAAVLSRPVAAGTVLRPADVVARVRARPGQALRLSGSRESGYALEAAVSQAAAAARR